MTVARIKATIFACVCDHCGHPWKAFTMPERCAKCGRRSWNGVDKRRGKWTTTRTKVETPSQPTTR